MHKGRACRRTPLSATTKRILIKHTYNHCMRMKTIILLTASLFMLEMRLVSGQNRLPVLSNVRTQVDTEKKVVTITYDLADPDNSNLKVTLKASDSKGEYYLLDTKKVTGAVGYPVTTGKNKIMKWSYDGQSVNSRNLTLKVIADDLVKVNIKQLVSEVDTVKLRATVASLYGIRNYKSKEGLAGLAKAKNVISKAMQANKLQVTRQDVSLADYKTHNIIGRKQGQEDETILYLLSAYFDTTEKSKGADFNASGVAGVLEAARILSKYNFKHSIVFAGFDLEDEESGGSVAYVFDGGVKDFEKLEGAFTLSGIGHYSDKPKSQMVPDQFDALFPEAHKAVSADQFKGNFIMGTANEASAGLVEHFEKTAKTYVPALKVVSLVAPENGKLTPELANSDHVAFWYGKYKAVEISDGGYSRDNNIMDDRIEKINFTFMRNVVRAVIASLATSAEIQHSHAVVVNVSNLAAK